MSLFKWTLLQISQEIRNNNKKKKLNWWCKRKALSCNNVSFSFSFIANNLFKVRLHLIDSVNEALLKDLIDGLRNITPPVLTGREANQILQAYQVTEDKTGHLIDMVCKKGNNASENLITILKNKAPEIAKKLDQDQDVVDARESCSDEITSYYSQVIFLNALC